MDIHNPAKVRTMRRILLVALVVCVATPTWGNNSNTAAEGYFPGYDPAAEAAREANAKSRLTGSASDLLSPNSDVRYLAYAQFVKERLKLIADLIAIVTNDSAPRSYNGPTHRAISLLGEYRAGEAVWVLLDRLTYLPPDPILVHSIGPYEDFYPSARALARIGQPAIEPLVGRIAATDDIRVRNLALWVLMQIDGKEQAEHRLATGASAAADSASRARLEAAAEYVRSYKSSGLCPYIQRVPWDSDPAKPEKR